MIFELLDAKRERIAVITDKNLVSGQVERDLDDRFVKDVLDVKFTINMREELEKARYIMLSDTGNFRDNPLFRIYQREVSDTVQIVATSYTTKDLGGYVVDMSKLNLVDGVTPISLVKGVFNKAGFGLILTDVVFGFNEFKVLKTQLDDGEVGLGDFLDELMKVLDVYGEFVTYYDRNQVALVNVRLAKELGKNISRGLVYGVNITRLRVDERVEDIITAVEYTGQEYTDEGGQVTGRLTLQNGGGADLPKSDSYSRVTSFTDTTGVTRYILEDFEATEKYGNYDYIKGKMNPIIETYQNTNITNIDDLKAEAVKKLDGKTIPKTEYQIEAELTGVDVGDNIEVRVDYLGINKYLKVLNIKYELGGRKRVSVVVGEYIKTELERRFEDLESNVGKGGDKDKPVDKERGKLLNTPVLPRTVEYSGKSYGNYDVPNWEMVMSSALYVDMYDYYLTFNYKIKEGYIPAYLELGISSVDIGNKDLSSNNGFTSSRVVTKVAEYVIDGGVTEGKVDIRLNDFSSFMKSATGTLILPDGTRTALYPTGYYITPFFTVYDVNGVAYTLNYLDYTKLIPTNEDELKGLSGYLTDFTITEHERTMVDE